MPGAVDGLPGDGHYGARMVLGCNGGQRVGCGDDLAVDREDHVAGHQALRLCRGVAQDAQDERAGGGGRDPARHTRRLAVGHAARPGLVAAAWVVTAWVVTAWVVTGWVAAGPPLARGLLPRVRAIALGDLHAQEAWQADVHRGAGLARGDLLGDG